MTHSTSNVNVVLATLLLASLAAVPAQSNRMLLQACPPPMLDSVADFNLTEYVRAPWFIQQQQPLVYQPASQLYCVRAQYIPVNPSNFSAGISVLNFANNFTVNGPAVGSIPGLGAPIVAFPAGDANSSTGASKLAVGIIYALPAYLAGNKAAFGPYWVVAVGTDPATGHYTCAIVSAGLPTVPSNGACRTGEPGATSTSVNGEGLWLFSRKQVDVNNTALMLQKAKDLGYDTSLLLPVKQEGCTYNGSEVPANFTSPLAMGSASMMAPGAMGPGPFAG